LAAALTNIALQPAQRELLEQAQSQLAQRGPGSAPHTPSAYLDALIASCGGDKQRETAMLLAQKKLAKADSGNQSYLLRGSRLLLAAVCVEAAEGGGGNGGSSPAPTAARSKLLHLLQRAEQLRPGAAGPALKLLSGYCKWVAARVSGNQVGSGVSFTAFIDREGLRDAATTLDDIAAVKSVAAIAAGEHTAAVLRAQRYDDCHLLDGMARSTDLTPDDQLELQHVLDENVAPYVRPECWDWELGRAAREPPCKAAEAAMTAALRAQPAVCVRMMEMSQAALRLQQGCWTRSAADSGTLDRSWLQRIVTAMHLPA
jgi:hypothetical protein